MSDVIYVAGTLGLFLLFALALLAYEKV